jgi:hypothetical protein
MASPSSDDVLRETDLPVYERAFAAVQKVQERLERACRALDRAEIPYAVIGGHAVAAWVATVDDGAVRNTRDVDLLLQAEDLSRATEALESAGFCRDQVMDVIDFLDGPDGKPSQGVHIIIAGQKVREDYFNPAPGVSHARIMNGRRTLILEELVRMKLNSYRDKDRTHLRDLIQVGLIDGTWTERFELNLARRLQQLLDDPHG